MRKLNSHGVAHHFALALLVVGIVSAGTFHAITSHALTDGGGGSASTKNTSISATATVNIKNPKLCTSARPAVTYGQHSSCVAYLQSRVGAGVDGQFGAGTASKVATIQKRAGLKDRSGHDVGPCTWAAINGEATSAACGDGTVSASSSAKPSPLVYCTYTLNPGHRVVTDAHISASACSQHSGAAHSTASPVSNYTVCKTAINKCNYTAKKEHYRSICTFSRAGTVKAGSSVTKYDLSSDAACAHAAQEIVCEWRTASTAVNEPLGKLHRADRTPGTANATECGSLQNAYKPVTGTCAYWVLKINGGDIYAYDASGHGRYIKSSEDGNRVSRTSTKDWCRARNTDNIYKVLGGVSASYRVTAANVDVWGGTWNGQSVNR